MDGKNQRYEEILSEMKKSEDINRLYTEIQMLNELKYVKQQEIQRIQTDTEERNEEIKKNY